MGHEAATRAPFIQLYSHPPHTAVQPTRIRTSERVLHPPQGVNTPPKDYTIHPSHRPIISHSFTPWGILPWDLGPGFGFVEPVRNPRLTVCCWRPSKITHKWPSKMSHLRFDLVDGRVGM